MTPLSQELWLLAVTGSFLLGGIVWAAILKKRVRQHTATMRELLRREAALRRRFVDLFESSSDAIYTHDLDYKITSWNRAAELLTGYTRDEILTKKISHLLTPESFERAAEMTKLKLQGQASTTYEIDLLAKDGRRIPVEVSTRLIDEEGKVVEVQGAARDISERKKAQEALRCSEQRHRLLFQRNMAELFGAPWTAGSSTATNHLRKSLATPLRRKCFNILRRSFMVTVEAAMRFWPG